MGVDDGDTGAISDIGDGHVGDEGGFTGTGFAEDIDVTTAVFPILDTKDGHAVSVLGSGKKVDLLLFFIA